MDAQETHSRGEEMIPAHEREAAEGVEGSSVEHVSSVLLDARDLLRGIEATDPRRVRDRIGEAELTPEEATTLAENVEDARNAYAGLVARAVEITGRQPQELLGVENE